MDCVQDSIEEAQEAIIDLTDELVYEKEQVLPEDMAFIGSLLSEYYAAYAEREAGSTVTCDIAWAFANELVGYIENTDEFDWINAHFLTDNFYRSVQIELLDLPAQEYNAKHPQAHPNGFSWKSDTFQYTNGFEEGEETLDELLHLIGLYVPLNDSSMISEDELSEVKSLESFFHIIQKRYAYNFPDDSAERNKQLELTQFVIEAEQSDGVNKREIYDAFRLVKRWTEQRAKREHQMLCVGVSK